MTLARVVAAKNTKNVAVPINKVSPALISPKQMFWGFFWYNIPMKYVLYVLTMAVLFVGGMIIGNVFLPEQAVVRASSVSVPNLDTSNPIFAFTNRETVARDIDLLNNALASCPVVVGEEKDKIVNHIKLWLALEDFELKKSILELEMAKNVDSNRPTAQFLQAVNEYNTAREKVEKMADELFPQAPPPTQEEQPAAVQ